MHSSSSSIPRQRQQHCGSRNLRSSVEQMRADVTELQEDMTQLKADVQRVLENTFRILHAVGTSTGRPSIASSLNNASAIFPSGSSGLSSSQNTNETSDQIESPSRKGSMQSVDDVSKPLQEPVWQPPVSKHTYQRRDSTLQTVSEEPASMTPDVPHVSACM